MKVYPMKIAPAVFEKPWGGGRLHTLFGKGEEGCRIGECSELSPTLRVAEGELAGVTLSQLAGRYGEEFTGGEKKGLPFGIRLVDAMHRTPPYVYPDEHEARSMHGHYELAIVLRAEVNAGIYAGMRDGLSREVFLERAARGTLTRAMHFLPAAAGDVFFLSGGLPVAVGGGVTLLAVSGGSDERFTAEGSEAEKSFGCIQMDLRAMKYVGKAEELGSRRVRRAAFGSLNAEEQILAGSAEEETGDRLTALFCAEGEGKLEAGGEERRFRKGDTFLIPAEAKDFRMEGRAVLYLFR